MLIYELQQKVKEELQDYSIIDLQIFITAMDEAIKKASVGSEIREKIIFSQIALKDLLFEKMENFLNNL